MNMNKTALELQQRVLALIARGVAQPTSDDEFNELARAIFAFQYEQCETYRAYCDRLKLTPSDCVALETNPCRADERIQGFCTEVLSSRRHGCRISHQRNDPGESR